MLRKTIAKTFDKNGFSIQLDAVRAIESLYPNESVATIETRVTGIIRNIYSILKQTGKENLQIVSKDLVEESVKLGLEDVHVQRSADTLRKFMSANQMDIEFSRDDREVTYSDKISEKIANSLIILSNFGEIPSISFKNQVRELTIIHDKERGILVSGKDLIERWIEKYHKMRYLMKNSGNYRYQHEQLKYNSSLDGLVTLHEIGSLFGCLGSYHIFGLVFKKGKQ